ncbi:hypothetical protein UA32_12260 [Photobacterium angustum]|nr:hypothetical protein UA32_12260 [Photobacterium angustum]
MITSIGYSYKLYAFYGQKEFKFHLNGKALGAASIISPLDLEIDNSLNSGTAKQVCQNVISERGYITTSMFNDAMICCNLSSLNSYWIPFKEVDNRRYYFCGAWPNIDIVSQQIKNAKLMPRPLASL